MPRTWQGAGPRVRPWRSEHDGAAAPPPIMMLCSPGSALPTRKSGSGHCTVCPCAAGFPLYERFRGEVKRLKKDPDPGVRAAALHVEHDACEIETIAAGLDKADEQGWRYSDTDWVSKHRQRQATGYPSDQPHLARLPETLATQKTAK